MVRSLDLTLDANDAERLADFWRAAVGYVDEPPPAPFADRREWLASYGEVVGPDEPLSGAWLVDPTGVLPRLSILAVPEPKTAKNRLHLDLRFSTATEPGPRWAQIQLESARLQAAGASVVATFDGHHITMADPEGNEFCVA